MKAQWNKLTVRMNLHDRTQTKFKVKADSGTFTYGKKADYLIQNDRVRFHNRKPFLEYVEGNAEPIDPYGGKARITAEQLNQHMRNRYVEQVMGLLGGSGLAKNLPIIMMIVVVVAAIANIYFGQRSVDHIDAVGDAVQALHTTAPPTPTQGVH